MTRRINRQKINHQKKYAWLLSLIAPLVAPLLPERMPGRKPRLSAVSTAPPKGSRLQRRLKVYGSRDRTFLDLLRRKRNQPSRLNQRLSADRSQSLLMRRCVRGVAIALTVGGLIWTNLFIQEKVTFAGVPYRIINKFWNDKPARTAYFVGDRQGLHDRLQDLGVEEDIKAYYRDRFDSEYELDKYIHQIMFDRTGYVGEAYRVNGFGELISIDY
ncbi:MAG: hypothetical protein AAGL17_21995 [Cyanobacteria bacterium J06576_12]